MTYKVRKNPTHTILIPQTRLLVALGELVEEGCTFTCEQSPRRADIWLVGVLTDGVAVVNRRMGPTTDVGTLGEWGVLDPEDTP